MPAILSERYGTCMSHPKTLIILPAFNEASNIVRTIANVRQVIAFADILVINDGSLDETGHLAAQAGALVVNLPFNLGIGAGVQTAFMYAERHGYEIVARNDGDGQHAPDGILRLLERVQAGDMDMVIGSRFLGDDYGTSLTRRLGIGFLARLLTSLTRQPITDPTSGYAAFNRRAIRLFARVYPHDYPEPEAIFIAHRNGLRLTEVPVTMRPRAGGRSSITPARSAYYMLKVTLAILINVLRRPIESDL